MRYTEIKDLANAIKNGDIKAEDLTGFICKGELFIRAGTPDDLYTAYYGSDLACESICDLLKIDSIEYV
jgi:hypothetical protein